jgi:hypothetical protein
MSTKIYVICRHIPGAALPAFINMLRQARPGIDFVVFDARALDQAAAQLSATLVKTMAGCAAVIVLVDPSFFDGRLPETVAAEIETAIELCLPIMPVLLEGAQWPQNEDVEPALQHLAQMQSVPFARSRLDIELPPILQAIDDVAAASRSAAAEYDRRLDSPEGDVPPTAAAAPGTPAREAASKDVFGDTLREQASHEYGWPPATGSPPAPAQAERDAEYRRRMDSPAGAVPPSIGAAPIRDEVITGAPSTLVPPTREGDRHPLNGALSAKEMFGARLGGESGGEHASDGPMFSMAGEPDDVAVVEIRKRHAPAVARPARKSETAKPRSYPDVAAASPEPTAMPARPPVMQAPPSAHYPMPPPPERAARSSGGRGLAVFGIFAAILVMLPLLSQRGRDGLGQTFETLLAALGVKLNAFSLLAIFKRKPQELPKLVSATNPIVDNVDCSVFAPPAAPPGSTIMVQVFLHIPEQAERAAFQAKLIDDTTTAKGVKSLATPIARGARVDISLDVADAQLTDDPVQSLTWCGEPAFVQFLLRLPQAADGMSIFPKIRISVDGGLVGCIAFRVGIAREAAGTQSVPSGESARRYKHAFLSYATADRKEVLKRAQVLKAAGVSFFQDILSLDPGDRWEKEIFKNIDTCDLFLLFWSKSARDSAYVLKEAEYALALQLSSGGDAPDIVPVIIEGPPVIVPPPSLSAIHFNDTISYLVAAS